MKEQAAVPCGSERLIRFLQASPEQQAAVDRLLAGKAQEPAPAPTGPLLMAMGAAARFLGVSRATLWRMIQAGRLERIELLPGSFRLRRADLEAVAGQHSVATPCRSTMTAQEKALQR